MTLEEAIAFASDAGNRIHATQAQADEVRTVVTTALARGTKVDVADAVALMGVIGWGYWNRGYDNAKGVWSQ